MLITKELGQRQQKKERGASFQPGYTKTKVYKPRLCNTIITSTLSLL